jgi:hypothetical protein
VRKDGQPASWGTTPLFQQANFYESGAGFRGLTCMRSTFPNDPQADMLIASYEGSGDIYAFQIINNPDGGVSLNPTIELHLLNWFGSQVAAEYPQPTGVASFAIAAFNNDMPELVHYGTLGCYDRLIGLGDVTMPSFPGDNFNGGLFFPWAGYTIRHCNGDYEPLAVIPSTDKLQATRAIIPSALASDPIGTIYAGGYVVPGSVTAINTDWLYRGAPQ